MPPRRRKPSGGRKSRSRPRDGSAHRSPEAPEATAAATAAATTAASSTATAGERPALAPAARAPEPPTSQAQGSNRGASTERAAGAQAAPCPASRPIVPAKGPSGAPSASQTPDPTPAPAGDSPGGAAARRNAGSADGAADDSGAAAAAAAGADGRPAAPARDAAASPAAGAASGEAPRGAAAGPESPAPREVTDGGPSGPPEGASGQSARAVAQEPSFSFPPPERGKGGREAGSPPLTAGVSPSDGVGSAPRDAEGSAAPRGEAAAPAPAAVGVAHLHHSKIKGGRWTVARFFLISCAYSSAWMAVASQMAYLRELHGPSVLLHLNVAYFVPPVPLLVACTVVDARLEARLGPARSLRARLVFALVAYACAALAVPRAAASLPALLTAVAILGLAGGVAYSASYQLVSKFANKSVIALGLGFCASGPLVGAFETILGVATVPTLAACWRLYAAVAGVAIAGCWASISVVNRHRVAIDGVLVLGVPPPEAALEDGRTPAGSRTLSGGCPLGALGSGAQGDPQRSRELPRALLDGESDAGSHDLVRPLLDEEGKGEEGIDDGTGAAGDTSSDPFPPGAGLARRGSATSSQPVPVAPSALGGSPSPVTSPYEQPLGAATPASAATLPYVPPIHLPSSAPTYVDPHALWSTVSNASQLHALASNPALLHAVSLPPSLPGVLPHLPSDRAASYLHSPVVSTSASRRISTALSWSMADLVDTTLGDAVDDEAELPLAGIVTDSLADTAGEPEGGAPISGTLLLGEDALVWQHHVEEELRHEAAAANADHAALPGSRGSSGSGIAALNDWLKQSLGDKPGATGDLGGDLSTPRRAAHAAGFGPPSRSSSGAPHHGRPPLPSPLPRSKLGSRAPTPQPSSVASLLAAGVLVPSPAASGELGVPDAGAATSGQPAAAAEAALPSGPVASADEAALPEGGASLPYSEADEEAAEKAPLLAGGAVAEKATAAADGAAGGAFARAPDGAAIVVTTLSPDEDGSPPSRFVVARRIAPHLTVMFVSTFLSLMLFPLFTLVPSSGRLGDALAARLFFAKVFADVAGRFLPRVSFAKPRTPTPLLLGVAFKCVLAATFVLYLRAPPGLRSDHFAVALVACIWLIGGWVNSGANMLAPARAGHASRAVAAGIVAIAFQAAHFAGLAAAAVIEHTLKR